MILTPSARRLLALALPAFVVGIAASLILLGLSGAAELLQGWLWSTVPAGLGIDGFSPFWILLMLTLTGLAVGLVIQYAPGHAGPDPATVGLLAPPLAVRALPGLILALVLMLAGGVSLGPEYPIMTVNVALAVAIGGRFLPAIAGAGWVGLAFAGTIGAMFGTPVAAALLLSESMGGDPKVPLWDRLFAPLVAAAAGAQTTMLLAGPSFALEVPDYPGIAVGDIIAASLVAMVAAIIGMVAVYVFPAAHAAFSRLGNPIVIATTGGLILGILGVIGGPVTLFKGLEEMQELNADAAGYTAAGLAIIVVVKLAALLVAATSGFRGGRIFPAVFIGVAIGLCAAALVPSIASGLWIAGGVLGMLLAVSRSGWLAIFMAIAVIPDVELLPVIVIAALPAWLIVAGRPQMEIPQQEATT